MLWWRIFLLILCFFCSCHFRWLVYQQPRSHRALCPCSSPMSTCQLLLKMQGKFKLILFRGFFSIFVFFMPKVGLKLNSTLFDCKFCLKVIYEQTSREEVGEEYPKTTNGDVFGPFKSLLQLNQKNSLHFPYEFHISF